MTGRINTAPAPVGITDLFGKDGTRMKRILVCIAALITLTSCPFAPAATGSLADAAFQREFGDSFLDQFWQSQPDAAVSAGYYKYADRLVVPNEKTRAEQLRHTKAWLERLHTIRPESLSLSNRIDWTILDNKLRSTIWYATEFRRWEWNPATYDVADTTALLLTTEYAPLEQRLRAVLTRLANVPAYYAAAKHNLKQPTREDTQLAIEQSEGALSVFGDDLQTQVSVSALNASERALFGQRIDATRKAIEDYIAWLKAQDARLVKECNARSFRVGRALYEQRFAYDIQSGGTAEELYQRAMQEKAQLLTRMNLLADQLWPKYFSNVAPPQDHFEKLSQLLGKLSEQHASPEQLLPDVERLIPSLENWITEHGLIDLDPTRPLQVRETPLYQRSGLGLAGIYAPGPYNPTAKTYFNITPLDGYTAARAESVLREYNNWMLPVLVMHEAIPGHYVQLMYANKSPSRIRSIFANGAMVEGWAVYSERMMLESGYGADTAEAWLMYSKWNLRSVCNTILDYSVHVLNMSQEDAIRLLTHEAFQSDEEAVGKWLRVQRSSVQLTSYFAGYAAIYDFREKLKREWRGRFDLKRFHEQFLSYGNTPLVLIEQLMTEQGPLAYQVAERSGSAGASALALSRE